MTDYVSTTPGLYPLPDWAKDELSDRKGRQKDDLIGGDEDEATSEAYERVRGDLIERQEDAELDLVVEGQGRWDDMLAHPLAVHDNVETRGIVRYYDNNNFYREPVVTGKLTPDGDVAAELESAAGLTSTPIQGVLPGPYTLADLATDELFGDESDFLAAVAEFLAAEVDAIEDIEALFLLEPSLVENPPDDDAGESVSEALDVVATAAETDVVVHPYWGSLEEKVYAHVLDADIDALGYDLVSDPDSNVYNAQEYGTTDNVALGVVDGQNTLVESPETIRERIQWFEEQTPSEEYGTIYASTNTELFYLPVNRFQDKLDALGAATQEVLA